MGSKEWKVVAMDWMGKEGLSEGLILKWKPECTGKWPPCYVFQVEKNGLY